MLTHSVYAVMTGVSHCMGLDADIQKIMAELSWNTKPKFLEYIDVTQNMTNNSLRGKLEGIQKARDLLQKTLQGPPSRRWEPFFEEFKDSARNIDPYNPAANEHHRRWARSVDSLNSQDWNQSLFEASQDDHNLRNLLKSMYGSAAFEDNSTVQNLSASNEHIRRARSIDSTLLSSQGWNRSLFQSSKEEDDNVMKMKLFRLMYESVKDSDLKIKRAELVKADYENSTGFDLGYVCGDASDKLNVMTDISKTLKRMYNTWKPVEHVNAYEQIANLAIEVTHLIDMVRMIEPV